MKRPARVAKRYRRRKIPGLRKKPLKKHLSPSRRRGLRPFFVQIRMQCKRSCSPSGPWGSSGKWQLHRGKVFQRNVMRLHCVLWCSGRKPKPGGHGLPMRKPKKEGITSVFIIGAAPRTAHLTSSARFAPKCYRPSSVRLAATLNDCCRLHRLALQSWSPMAVRISL